MENTLTTNTQNAYETLITSFFADAKIANVDPMEKKKFIAICQINKLNPFKGEIYAIPRKDSATQTTKLSVVINYNEYLKRAEASGKLSGWNVLIKKDNGAVIGGKITIYRKDWAQPFEYEGDIKDFIVDNSPLWRTKAEAMMRKQLIRVGFGYAFPENCASLNFDDKEIPADAEVIPSEIIETPAIVEEDPEFGPRPISNDQIWVIKALAEYLPEEITSPDTYAEAEDMIHKLKVEIGRLCVQEKSLTLTETEINQIFSGTAKDMVAIKKAALELIKVKK